MIPKHGYGFLFAVHMAIAISEIFSVKEWPDFEFSVCGRST